MALFDFEAVTFGDEMPSADLHATAGGGSGGGGGGAAGRSSGNRGSSAGGSSGPRARGLAIYIRGGHAVSRFFRELRPRLTRPYVLITSGTDACAPARNLEAHLEDPHMLAWFARNPSVIHPKLQPLPVGIDASHNTSLYARALALASEVARDRLLYASFTLRADASSKDRNDALHAARRIGAERGAFWHTAPPRLPETEDLFNMLRSKFVVSPVGNGPDCTRTYRALLVGTIPILSRASNPLVRTPTPHTASAHSVGTQRRHTASAHSAALT